MIINGNKYDRPEVEMTVKGLKINNTGYFALGQNQKDILEEFRDNALYLDPGGTWVGKSEGIFFITNIYRLQKDFVLPEKESSLLLVADVCCLGPNGTRLEEMTALSVFTDLLFVSNMSGSWEEKMAEKKDRNKTGGISDKVDELELCIQGIILTLKITGGKTAKE